MGGEVKDGHGREMVDHLTLAIKPVAAVPRRRQRSASRKAPRRLHRPAQPLRCAATSVRSGEQHAAEGKKNAVITGSTSGNRLGIAKALAAEG